MLLDPKWKEKVEISEQAIEPWQVLLLHAATLLETRGWTRKAWVDCAGRMCAARALDTASTQLRLDGTDQGRAYAELDKHISKSGAVYPVGYPPLNRLISWNDSVAETERDVIDLFRRAARRE